MGKGRDTEIKLWFIWEYITSCETEKGTERSNKREERKIRQGNVKCQVKTVGDRAIVSDKPLNTISSLGHAFYFNYNIALNVFKTNIYIYILLSRAFFPN